MIGVRLGNQQTKAAAAVHLDLPGCWTHVRPRQTHTLAPSSHDTGQKSAANASAFSGSRASPSKQ